jgi:hypothetical protein
MSQNLVDYSQGHNFEKVYVEKDYSFDKEWIDSIFSRLSEKEIAYIIFTRFGEIGYHFETIAIDFEIMENGKTATRISFLFENFATIVIVNLGLTLKERDIERHLERMEIFRRYLERCRGTKKDLIGVIAGEVFPDHVKKFAIESGFYTIIQSGDTMKIDVPEGFKPRIF